MQLTVAGVPSVLGFNMLTALGQLLTERSSAVIVAFTMPMWAALFSVIFFSEAFLKERALPFNDFPRCRFDSSGVLTPPCHLVLDTLWRIKRTQHRHTVNMH